ncbi:hypothetical protein GCK72_001967 [Caenorhabditis remanei]|uniref:Uncharacterized protein n=1 Tax=Caenorhabditis remanei TaxID=31234 RepID=A0A6A5HR27_CAERE|nr:hypothetical protein GCK72_001967 [Caenorhabditis remanei]KAF1770149.1 hypothetical protein GCK72_001967 [Caenorhabditis remanei]
MTQNMYSMSPSETSSSEYNTDPDIDLEWELYKIRHAPVGPVPPDQIYLTFTCQKTDLYVKAVVDEGHSIVHILTYEKISNEQWKWTETKCSTCIDKVRRVLADGECVVPFAIDMESKENFEFGDVNKRFWSSEIGYETEDETCSVIEMPLK